MSERDVQDSLKFMREKLRKERKAQNMSQLTLSAEADLACNTICRIEKGTAEPGIGNLLRLTDALHIPMSELFPQGEGPKAKEIGIIDDAQLQEIISLWHKIPGKARGSADELHPLLAGGRRKRENLDPHPRPHSADRVQRAFCRWVRAVWIPGCR